MSHIGMAMTIGFALGLRHATDPDHVVAMSTLISRTKRFGASWLLGACWGLGHTLTIFIVGVLIIALRIRLPLKLQEGMEFSVGIMLVLLGALSLWNARWGRWNLSEHSHEHEHEDKHRHHLPHQRAESAHAHVHVHAHIPALEALARGAGSGRMFRSFGVGLVHGLAGSGAIALLVLAAIPGVWAGLAYLAVFGVGTLAGMMILSTLMELAMVWMVRRWIAVDRLLVSSLGTVSVAFGLYIMYQIGFVGYAPH